MKWSKIMLLAVASAVLAVLATGCAYFNSDDTAKPYLKSNKKAAGPNNSEQSNDYFPPEADLQSGTPRDAQKNEDLAGMNKPGEYKEGAGVNNYDGFGTPIAGVTFQPLYFKFDQSIVDPDEAAKVDAVIKYLQDNPGTGVVIEGNCDNRGTAEYNRALGERRALAAQEMMVGAGIDAARIKTLSYGEEKVTVQGDTEEAHAGNRRDDFVVVKLAK